jgi:hypothetical protein
MGILGRFELPEESHVQWPKHVAVVQPKLLLCIYDRKINTDYESAILGKGLLQETWFGTNSVSETSVTHCVR